MRRASTNFNAQLGVHFFLWLEVRGAVTLDGTNHPRIKISPGVACCARFTGWTQPHSHVRGQPRRPCRVARWSNLIKPLQWELGLHAYCLSPAAQLITVSSGGVFVQYVSWSA